MSFLPQVFRAAAAALLVAAFVAAAGGAEIWAAGQPADEPPVVVELFTSQGCSSCPPADALLAELAARPDVLALSLNVDYWDYIGWRDPYGSPVHTQRQRAYGQALNLHYVFTPQIVIDGRTSVVGSRREDVLNAIAAAKTRPKTVEVAFAAGNGGSVIVPAGHAPAEGGTIWLVVYDRSQTTDVPRGENAGRTIENANVVRTLERLGTWMGERLEIPLNLDDAAASGRFGCAVIVQQGRIGPVLGAASMRLDGLDR